MKGLGEGIAFAALVAAAVCLELAGKSATGLWVLIVIWAICTGWGNTGENRARSK